MNITMQGYTYCQVYHSEVTDKIVQLCKSKDTFHLTGCAKCPYSDYLKRTMIEEREEKKEMSIILKHMKITCNACGQSFTLIHNQVPDTFKCPHCKTKHEHNEVKTE